MLENYFKLCVEDKPHSEITKYTLLVATPLTATAFLTNIKEVYYNSKKIDQFQKFW